MDLESTGGTMAVVADADNESRLTGDLAWLLFRLAGRVGDEVLALLRASVADGELDGALELLEIALIDQRPALTPDEAQVVDDVMRRSGGPPLEPPPVLVAGLPPTDHRFLPPPGPASAELLSAVVSAGRDVGGLRACWHARRESASGTAVVWFAEADPLADVIELTAEIQHRLVSAGDAPPRVEVFAQDEVLNPYQEEGLAAAALAWVRDDLPAPRLARTFDDADAPDRSRFVPGHARLEGADRDRVLAYLRAADGILHGYGLTEDVLASQPRGAVRLGYRGDGTWIWSEGVIHYLDRYGVAPETGLLAHVLAAGGLPRSLGRLDLHRAMTALGAGPAQAPHRSWPDGASPVLAEFTDRSRP